MKMHLYSKLKGYGKFILDAAVDSSPSLSSSSSSFSVYSWEKEEEQKWKREGVASGDVDSEDISIDTAVETNGIEEGTSLPSLAAGDRQKPSRKERWKALFLDFLKRDELCELLLQKW